MILSAIAAKLKDDFKGRHFEAGLIVQAVLWYLHYPLSYRDIEELLLERGLEVDHSSVNRWVLTYAPLIERRLRPVSAASLRVGAGRRDLCPDPGRVALSVPRHRQARRGGRLPATARRDLEAAKRFFLKMLKDGPLLSPDRIGTDGAGNYPGAIATARNEGRLARDPVHYVTKHLQQGLESDHFRLKKNMPRSAAFRASTRLGDPSRGSKPCYGYARGSASPHRPQAGQIARSTARRAPACGSRPEPAECCDDHQPRALECFRHKHDKPQSKHGVAGFAEHTDAVSRLTAFWALHEREVASSLRDQPWACELTYKDTVQDAKGQIRIAGAKLGLRMGRRVGSERSSASIDPTAFALVPARRTDCWRTMLTDREIKRIEDAVSVTTPNGEYTG